VVRDLRKACYTYFCCNYTGFYNASNKKATVVGGVCGKFKVVAIVVIVVAVVVVLVVVVVVAVVAVLVVVVIVVVVVVMAAISAALVVVIIVVVVMWNEQYVRSWQQFRDVVLPVK
jgi:hypothetical protein